MNRPIIAAATAAIAIAALSGCTRTVVVHDKPSDNGAISIPTDVPAPSTSTAFDYSTTGMTIALKTVRQACFGSAGCNVTVKPVITVIDPASIPTDATGAVTYEIDGGTDGPVINTLTLTGSQFSSEQSFLSTDSAATRLTVKITDTTTN